MRLDRREDRQASPSGRGDRRTMQSLTVPGPGPNVPTPSRLIPVADVPVQPPLSFAGSTAETERQAVRSVLDVGPALYTTSGQAAIALAARLMDISPGDQVLLPAYHCVAMFDPFSVLGAEPSFYRIKPDLSVDLDDLRAKIGPRTRVVIVVHYFGFPQSMEAIRQICDERGVFLLEDCAHSFFGESDGLPVGGHGDFAVASFWKFFPVPAGGCLVSSRQRISDIRLGRQGLKANLRTAVSLVDEANYYGRLRPLAPFTKLLKTLAGLRRRGAPPGPSGSVEQAQPDTAAVIQGDFEPHMVDLEMSAIERWICHRQARQSMADRRREHYRQLLAALAELPGCRALFPELPPKVVPYLFPIRVEQLEKVFPRLEDAAIPMQRFGQFLWPGVDERVCAVASDLSHKVVQLPCHQGLKDAELDWMVERFSDIVRA